LTAFRRPLPRLLLILATVVVAGLVALQGAVAAVNAVEHAPGVAHVGALSPAAHAAAHATADIEADDPHFTSADVGEPGAADDHARSDTHPAGAHHHHAEAAACAPLLPAQFPRQALTCSAAAFSDARSGGALRVSLGLKRPPRSPNPRTT
jgi:hypothetical protein